MGGVTSIFAILFIILGVLLPKDERELSEKERKIAIAIMIVMVLLFIFTFSWKVLDNKEHYGEAKIGGILIPMVIVLTIFSAAGIYGWIKTEHDLSKSPLVRTTKKIEMNKQENKNPKVNVYTMD